MDEKLIEMLSSDKFEHPYEAISEINRQKGIANKVLEYILNMEDKLVAGEFLESFIYLSNEQLESVKQYISLHINDKDHLFVSSLIECANVNGFVSFYDQFLDIICSRRNDLVVLAALDFIFDNLQFYKIKDIVRVFRRVINNKNYYQNCQVVASLYLFRITMSKEYLDFLYELILDFGEQNFMILKNVLKNTGFNNKKYFFYYDELMKLMKKGEERYKTLKK